MLKPFANSLELPPLEFRGVLETGFPDVDDDHRQLIDDANRLLTALQQAGPWPEILALAGAMRADCVAHFRREEAVLQREGFGKITAHAAEHARIERELADILATLAAAPGPSEPMADLALAFRSILIDHFYRYDMSYKSHLLVQANR